MKQENHTSFVAEVSSNHHRDLSRCFTFIDCAAEIGCDAVKFQLFRVSDLFAPEILERSSKHRQREKWELPVSFLAPLAERARKQNLQFACTPFSLDAVSELAPHIDFLKVASYELLWEPLLRACTAQEKPLVLSTGMATFEEVEHAVEVLADSGCKDLTLLHCVSGYPTPHVQANLAALDTLRALQPRLRDGNLRIGWSDHTTEPGVIQRAVHHFGAQMIEFHLDIDGRGEEFAAGHCWLPEAMREVIRQVRIGQEADGDGKKVPAPCELSDREWRADPNDGLRPLQSARRTFTP